ncbi:MAG: tetratricopeptide repeat protein [Candidatus Rokubacteria bacterium]|nr:tetratricopeptide repeat protein [Candidatus Rokubacteria bacterium]
MQLATVGNPGLVGNLNESLAEHPRPPIPLWSTEVAGRGSGYLAHWTGTTAVALPHVGPMRQAPPPAVPELVPGLVSSNVALVGRPPLVRYARANFNIFTTAMAIRASRIEASGTSSTLFDETRSKLVPYLALVRSLLERDEIAAARNVLDAVPLDASDQPEMRRLKRLLAPPRVTVSRARDVDRTREYRWLQDHWQEHRGQWVAVDGDSMLASAGSLKELRETLKALNVTRPPLVHRIA